MAVFSTVLNVPVKPLVPIILHEDIAQQRRGLELKFGCVNYVYELESGDMGDVGHANSGNNRGQCPIESGDMRNVGHAYSRHIGPCRACQVSSCDTQHLRRHRRCSSCLYCLTHPDKHTPTHLSQLILQCKVVCVCVCVCVSFHGGFCYQESRLAQLTKPDSKNHKINVTSLMHDNSPFDCCHHLI